MGFFSWRWTMTYVRLWVFNQILNYVWLVMIQELRHGRIIPMIFSLCYTWLCMEWFKTFYVFDCSISVEGYYFHRNSEWYWSKGFKLCFKLLYVIYMLLYYVLCLINFMTDVGIFLTKMRQIIWQVYVWYDGLRPDMLPLCYVFMTDWS